MKSKWLTNVIHQLVGGKVVKDIVCSCVLSNSVSLRLPKHLLLSIVGKERCREGETSTKQTHTKGSPSSLALLLLILIIVISFRLLMLGGKEGILLLGSALGISLASILPFCMLRTAMICNEMGVPSP